MLTIKNWIGKIAIFFPLIALLLSGCTPPGPRALLDGKKLLDRGDFSDAIAKLQTAATLMPTNSLAWDYLGIAWHQSGEITNAVRAYQQALTLDPDLTEAHYNLGCLWLEQNRPDLAKAELTAFTLRDGNSADGWLKLGEAQLHLRELTLAEKSFNESLRLSPKNPEAFNGLGLVQLQRNRASDAVRFFNGALKLQPDYAPALLNLAIVYENNLNNRPFALQKYREYLALKTRPENWDAVNAHAQVLERELAPAAASAPTSANSTSPKSSTNPKSTPIIEQNTKPQVAKSAEPVRSAPEAKTDAAPTARTEIASASPARSNESVKPEKRGLLQQMNPMNLFHRGAKNPSAKTETTPSPGGTDSQTDRYRYQNPPAPVAGDRGAAERAFRQGVQAQTDQDFAEAIRDYRQATQADPAFYDAYYNLGLAETSAGHLPEAARAYEFALAIRPDSLDGRYGFALVLKRMRFVPDAVNELEKLLERYPNDARTHLALANIYAQELHQQAKARAHYLKVLDLDPRNPQASAIRFWLTSNQP
jgi:Flp pilus assembly protein TadD